MNKFTQIKELLSAPDKWTYGTYARNAENFPVDARDLAAVRWCLAGAVQYVCYKEPALETLMLKQLESKIKVETGFGEIPLWNDAPERTYADVVKLVTELEDAETNH